MGRRWTLHLNSLFIILFKILSVLSPSCLPSFISSINLALNAGRSSGFLLVTNPLVYHNFFI
jgi:hypothetical protein